MMCGNVFRLQLMAAFADTRRIVLRVGVCVLLAMPFIFIDMPARAQAAGIVMVILFSGFFGAATGHTRLRCDSRLARLALLPISRVAFWLDLVLASALTRLVPVVVVLAGFVIVNGRGATPAALTSLLGLLLCSLILVTLLGMGTGRLARSNGEVHLFGALVCGGLAFVSGVAPIADVVGGQRRLEPDRPAAGGDDKVVRRTGIRIRRGIRYCIAGSGSGRSNGSLQMDLRRSA
ncbi:MAG: hypothetical protein ACYS14_10270 [Planctomycetota bacterium]|jgi:hypothetical protein